MNPMTYRALYEASLKKVAKYFDNMSVRVLRNSVERRALVEQLPVHEALRRTRNHIYFMLTCR
jgi:hypothetical protein